MTLALDALSTVHAAGRLPAKALLSQVAPALQARAKKTALHALGLVDRAASAERPFAGRAALVAVEALTHENVDVQARALALAEKWGDRQDRAFVARVRELVPSVAATLRSKVAALVGKDAPEQVQVRRKPEAKEHARTPAPSVPQQPPLARAGSLDEAIDLLAGAIERFESPDEMEGALAGVARFCGDRPADFASRIAPLAKRATKLLEKNPCYRFHCDSRGDLCAVAQSWAAPHALDPAGTEGDMKTFLSGRIREVAVRAGEGRPATLLGTPTHLDGWIDPDVLVARVIANDATPDPLDAVQSLLRIARDGRPQALARAAKVPGEYGAALRFALGGEREQEPRVPESDLWLSAEATRAGDNLAPRFDLLRHPMQLSVGFDAPYFVQLESLTMRSRGPCLREYGRGSVPAGQLVVKTSSPRRSAMSRGVSPALFGMSSLAPASSSRRTTS